TREGKRYAHVIDPRTGRPADHALNSVSILHESCAMADALATGLLVLSLEQAMAIAEREGIAAYFVIETDDGLGEKYTPGFADHFSDENGD
ncbi:MAG TPA: FAD:protein FMN transferase, partial [Gammaproteobacteria bacterium]|nr:FAD:protein FMN transferase [Gammaproteobacteria bacterium]